MNNQKVVDKNSNQVEKIDKPLGAIENKEGLI